MAMQGHEAAGRHLVRAARLAGGALALGIALVVPALAAEEVAFTKAPAGVLFRARLADDRVVVQDGAGRALGEVRVEADRVKLRDPAGAETWKVKRKEGGDVEVEDGRGQRLYRIRSRPGGQWQLEDAAKAVLARATPRETGFEVRDARGATIAKVKSRDGRVVYETEAGARIAELSGTGDARAGCWLALDRFAPAERAALWAYFARVHR